MVVPFDTVSIMIPMMMTDMSTSMVALRPIQSPRMPKVNCPRSTPMSCRYWVASVQT